MREAHGGEVEWEASRKYGMPVEKIVSFATTVSYITPKLRFEDFSDYAYRYPPLKFTELYSKIGKLNGLRGENVILGSGTEELIYLFFQELGRKEAIISVPTYISYIHAAKRYSRPVVVKAREDFDLDVDGIQERATRRTKAIVLCNPNNPTGNFYRKADVVRLAKLARDIGAVLLVDENYVWFVDEGLQYSMAPMAKKYPVFVLNGLSKVFGMPGLRVGWGIGPESFIRRLEEVKIPTTISTPSLFLTNKLLDGLSGQKSSVKRIMASKRKFYEDLKGIKSIKVFPSSANFFLIKLPGAGASSTDLFNDLAKRGLLIRDCAAIDGLDDTFIRVTVRSEEENAMLVNAIKALR